MIYSMLFKWNIIIILISTFRPVVCVVAGRGRSRGVVTVAGGGIGDVSGGMVVREGEDGY